MLEQRAVGGEPRGGEQAGRRAERRAQAKAARALVVHEEAGPAHVEQDRGGVQDHRVHLVRRALPGEVRPDGEQRGEQRRARALRGQLTIGGEERLRGARCQFGGADELARVAEGQAADGAAHGVGGKIERAGQGLDFVDIGGPLESPPPEQRAGRAARDPHRRREALQPGVAAVEDRAILRGGQFAVASAPRCAASPALGVGPDEPAELGDAGCGKLPAAGVEGHQGQPGDPAEGLLNRPPAFGHGAFRQALLPRSRTARSGGCRV